MRGELADAFADLELPKPLEVLDIVPPHLIDAESVLSVVIAQKGGPIVHLALPSSLAFGYLADEEAAVDEWRLWIHDIVARFSR
ncbi:MAG: hypothetical protein PVJ43_03470 [Gemmatimonadales bacterium]